MRYQEIEEKVLDVDGVTGCAPHLEGLVLIGTGRFYAGGVVVGIDFEKEKNVGKIPVI